MTHGSGTAAGRRLARTPTPSGKVHPLAAIFPRLSDEELADLAGDIRLNGLMSPIVLDENGDVVDGLNRDEACRRAGIEPRYTLLPARWRDDVAGFVLAVNVSRRHLTAGQRAAIAVRLRAVSGKPMAETAEEAGTSKARIAFAAKVLNQDPELLDAVIAGEASLNDAYFDVCARERAESQPDPDPMTRTPPELPPPTAVTSALIDKPPLNPAPTEDLDEAAQWLQELTEAVIFPLGQAALGCTQWNNHALRQYPLSDEQLTLLREEIAPPIRRVLDVLSGDAHD